MLQITPHMRILVAVEPADFRKGIGMRARIWGRCCAFTRWRIVVVLVHSLARRAGIGELSGGGKDLGAPIQMCDALSWNMPDVLRTIVAHCLAHARRNFVDLVDVFPEETEYVLRQLSHVYRVDAEARRKGLSHKKRLALHRAKSRRVMGAPAQMADPAIGRPAGGAEFSAWASDQLHAQELGGAAPVLASCRRSSG
ncbi:MAG: hypothetical protein KatS3mg111_1060 [Pirellulaceae bacterium]|nr:MAG: hypothetical protein KatS3mg111_1060 [Pirellulaceae bacterium]